MSMRSRSRWGGPTLQPARLTGLLRIELLSVLALGVLGRLRRRPVQVGPGGAGPGAVPGLLGAGVPRDGPLLGLVRRMIRVVGLSKVAALEYAAQGSRDSGGVTVNCICPGWVETPLIEPQVQARMGDGDREDGVRALLAEKQPSLRMTLPSEIAELAVFLCRREAHNITGTAIPVDGGWTSQ